MNSDGFFIKNFIQSKIHANTDWIHVKIDWIHAKIDGWWDSMPFSTNTRIYVISFFWHCPFQEVFTMLLLSIDGIFVILFIISRINWYSDGQRTEIKDKRCHKNQTFKPTCHQSLDDLLNSIFLVSISLVLILI